MELRNSEVGKVLGTLDFLFMLQVEFRMEGKLSKQLVIQSCLDVGNKVGQALPAPPSPQFPTDESGRSHLALVCRFWGNATLVYLNYPCRLGSKIHVGVGVKQAVLSSGRKNTVLLDWHIAFHAPHPKKRVSPQRPR